MSEYGFNPNSTVSIAATSTTGRVAVPGATKHRRRIQVTIAAGDDPAFLAFGDDSVNAALTDMPVLPGTTRDFFMQEGQTHVAAICASTETATVYITEGQMG